MRFSLTTWNINSVRLRIDIVAKFLKSARPDVLCLQETKCIDDAFPLKRFKRLGYEHVALNGQKGYHGVAIVSKLPFETTDIRTFCDKIDSRHISVAFGEKAQLAKPLVLHNFYVPAGGDIPDPALNPKFDHKLRFLDEMKACEPLHPRGDDRHILVGDLNVAPHENDVWSHKQLLKVVSHTPIECEKLLAAQAHGEWFDVARERIPLSEKVYTWWSYRAADWTLADRGRRLDHIWVSRALKDGVSDFRITRDARGWERPSDHVPVTVTLECSAIKSSASRPPSGYRWRSGWCGWRIRRAAGAPHRDRFPVRAGTGCARPGSPWSFPAPSRSTVAASGDEREFAEQGARPRHFAPPPSSTRNAPRSTMKPASASSPSLKRISPRAKLRCSEPIASMRSAVAPSRRRVGTRSSRATSSSIDMDL
jgi:exodeoxyribonuclease-3